MIPVWFKLNADSDDTKAGWHVPNSVNVRDIVPEWRRPGGGVTQADLCKTPACAVHRAIAYTKVNIAEAELHLKKLESALEEIANV